MKVILLFFFLLSLSSLSVLAFDCDNYIRFPVLPPPDIDKIVNELYYASMMHHSVNKWVLSYPNISCSDVPYPESRLLYTKSDVFIQTTWYPTLILKFISALFKSIFTYQYTPLEARIGI